MEQAVPWIKRHKPDPSLMKQLLKQRMMTDNHLDTVARRLDHSQQSHGVVVRHASVQDCLCRQPDAQIAPSPRHHADAAHNVMIDLAAAAIDFVVDGREIVLHVDPLRDHERRRHNRFEQFSGGILPIIVGMEERMPVQVYRLGQAAASDHHETVL